MRTQSPATTESKFQTYWEYHWKFFLAGAALVVVLVVCLISVFAQTKYDTSVLMATSGKNIHADQPVMAALQKKLNEYGADIDGNGTAAILLDIVDFTSSEFSQGDMGPHVRLTAELQAGTSQLYIFDKSIYENFLGDGEHYLNLAKAFPQYDIPLEYAVPLSDTPLGDLQYGLPEEGLYYNETEADYIARNEAILDDLYLVFRVDSGLEPARREAQYALLERLLQDAFR